jgi:ADP-heptose:LPS heptosyltransferase
LQQRILVIKHGALGDFILAMNAFKAIRQAHQGARIVLLTSSPFETLAQQTGYFDAVWVDNRAKWYRVLTSLKIRRLLNGGPAQKSFHRIYDLQGSTRTATYYAQLKRPRPEWVGAVSNCSHPRPHSPGLYHVQDSQQQHLATAGVNMSLRPDLDWLTANIDSLNLPNRFVCMIPGCSFKHTVKRWAAAGYAKLIDALAQQGIHSVLTGAGSDKVIIDDIIAHVTVKSACMNLCDASPFAVLAELARRAELTVGSDTGPMHIAAATGSPVLILFSNKSKPARLCAPKGEHVNILEADDLRQLAAGVVQKRCEAITKHRPVLPQQEAVYAH